MNTSINYQFEQHPRYTSTDRKIRIRRYEVVGQFLTKQQFFCFHLNEFRESAKAAKNSVEEICIHLSTSWRVAGNEYLISIKPVQLYWMPLRTLTFSWLFPDTSLMSIPLFCTPVNESLGWTPRLKLRVQACLHLFFPKNTQYLNVCTGGSVGPVPTLLYWCCFSQYFLSVACLEHFWLHGNLTGLQKRLYGLVYFSMGYG